MDDLSANVVFRQHAHLISVCDSRTETVVGGNAGEGILLVTKRLFKSLAGGTEKIGDGHIVNSEAQCQCVDEHTHRVGDFEIAAPAADGAKIDLTVVGVT